jgi:hypothetical protein
MMNGRELKVYGKEREWKKREEWRRVMWGFEEEDLLNFVIVIEVVYGNLYDNLRVREWDGL